MPSLALARPQPMTADDFLVWCLDEARAEEKWEFVDGEPVELMAGATFAHDAIVVNLIAGLHMRLRGGPCRPMTGDQAVKTRAASRVRRPDVIVDCGARDAKGLFAPTPVVLFEVLSPSTENVVKSAKLEEYQGLSSVQEVVLLDQDIAAARIYRRAGNDAWTVENVSGLRNVVSLASIGASLAMAEIYDGVAVPADA